MRIMNEEAHEFNEACKNAIDTEMYDEFLEERGFTDAWEALEHLIKLLYNEESNEF